MVVVKAVDSYSQKLSKFYEMLSEMSLTGKILLSLAMAFSIGVLAQVRVFLPWTPVPVVMTQLGIITYASVMGRKWGTLPVGLYVLGGILGIPWFSGYGSGMSYLLGPTGGYLIGFIISAWFISHISNLESVKGKVIPLITIVAISQLVIIYVPGLLQLNYWLQAVSGETVGLNNLLLMGFYPFIIGDVLKIVIGSLILFAVGRK